MNYLVIRHTAYEKDILTVIHHGDLVDDPPDITFVDAKSLFEAASRAHDTYYPSDRFTKYRIIVLPLSKSDQGPMEFLIDPPGERTIRPATRKPRKKS